MSKNISYKLSRAWTLRQSGKSLFVSGGADAEYEIELDKDEPSFFSTLKSNDSFTRQKLSLNDQRVLEELVAAEIVVPVLNKAMVLRVALLGDKIDISLSTNDDVRIVDPQQDYDLALILRTKSTYAELLDQLSYQNLSIPHLLVDLAYHHTASIGPLVFPGETACIACLQGRITTRWGDQAPPKSPKSTKDNLGIVAELTMIELSRIASGDNSLVNKTVSWNFHDRAVDTNQLLKVPLCPVCTQNIIAQSGALELPWSKQ